MSIEHDKTSQRGVADIARNSTQLHATDLGISLAFELLVGKVLHGFKVHEGICDSVMPVVVLLVHLGTELLSPECHADGQVGVQSQAHQHHGCHRPDLEVDEEPGRVNRAGSGVE